MIAPADMEPVLTGCRCWEALPQHYSIAIFADFRADRSGEMVWGLGQTVHAWIPFDFAVREPAAVAFRFERRARERSGRLVSHTTTYEERVVAVEFVHGTFAGTADIIAPPFRFEWMLRFAASPFPREIAFPDETPLEYFGYRA